jgi:hypothetical protein
MTSDLQVRNESTFTPDPGPRGPMASENGVVGSHIAYSLLAMAKHIISVTLTSAVSFR